MTTKLMTVAEVAERLRCSRWGVYAMARDGRLTAVRGLSRQLLFTEQAVEKAVHEAEQRPRETEAS
jgi:excisionase family DNA binding protein